jgi:Diacylglycerol kinase catalytic domain
LPEVRNFCARNPDIFHYEVEEIGQVSRALEMIARVKPKVLVVNGGDGTVQAALTELYHGGHFKGTPPPVAVLPNGKTNLIALDLGADGSPLKALEAILAIAQGNDLNQHIVARELIALTDGSENARPVIGMFLGGAGLADSILYCRHKIYPLGLPNGLSHFLTVLAVSASVIFGMKADFLPPKSNAVRISLLRDGELSGRFSVLVVTTLEKLLLGGKAGDGQAGGRLKLLAVDQRPLAILRVVWASLIGLLGKKRYGGVHISDGDIIQIDGDESSVVLDGEIFKTGRDRPILLRSTPPVPFLKLAA